MLILVFLYRDDCLSIFFFVNRIFFIIQVLVIFFHFFWQNAQTAVLIKEEIKKQDKHQGHPSGDIDVARAHPCHGKHEDLSTKGVFQILLGGGSKFEIDEFGRHIKNHYHNTRKYFAVVQVRHMVIQIRKNGR